MSLAFGQSVIVKSTRSKVPNARPIIASQGLIDLLAIGGRASGKLYAFRESSIKGMDAFEFCLSINPDPSVTFSKPVWDNYLPLEPTENPIFIPFDEIATRGVGLQRCWDTRQWDLVFLMDVI